MFFNSKNHRFGIAGLINPKEKGQFNTVFSAQNLNSGNNGKFTDGKLQKQLAKLAEKARKEEEEAKKSIPEYESDDENEENKDPKVNLVAELLDSEIDLKKTTPDLDEASLRLELAKLSQQLQALSEKPTVIALPDIDRSDENNKSLEEIRKAEEQDLIKVEQERIASEEVALNIPASTLATPIKVKESNSSNDQTPMTRAFYLGELSPNSENNFILDKLLPRSYVAAPTVKTNTTALKEKNAALEAELERRNAEEKQARIIAAEEAEEEEQQAFVDSWIALTRSRELKEKNAALEAELERRNAEEEQALIIAAEEEEENELQAIADAWIADSRSRELKDKYELEIKELKTELEDTTDYSTEDEDIQQAIADAWIATKRIERARLDAVETKRLEDIRLAAAKLQAAQEQKAAAELKDEQERKTSEAQNQQTTHASKRYHY